MLLCSPSAFVIFGKFTYLLILVIPVVAEDELICGLAGERGGNSITVCMHDGTKCEGALWETQWAIARASCLADTQMFQMDVIKSYERKECTEYVTELLERSPRVRAVRVVYKHPLYEKSPGPRPEHDLALLQLEYPYAVVERLVDTSLAKPLLHQFEPWVENTIRNNQLNKPYVRPHPRRFGIGVFESPVKTFISMVVIPSALFLVFFFFITYYTKPKNRHPLRQYENI